MPKQKKREESEQAKIQESARLTAQDTKFALATKLIRRLRDDLEHLEHLLASDAGRTDTDDLLQKLQSAERDVYAPIHGSHIIEGVFDGQNMIGSDGRQYIVPPNYASKSKLVEGDILKLTIQPNGTFLFKQIGPIERQRVVGALLQDELNNDWKVVALGKKYTVLSAAVSYHKGAAGDEAIILLPKAAPSKWAALENVIKKE